jgi:DNA polymerase-3 subunit delta'
MHNVIGQKEIQLTWGKMLASGQIPHAMVLSGDDGYGGLSLTLNLVEALLCQTSRNDIDASSRESSLLQGCGHCPSCKKMRELTHPDLHVAFPMLVAARKKQGQAARGTLNTMLKANPYLSIDSFLNHFNTEGKKNIAGNITSEDVKQILSNLTLSSFAGGWKVQIIWHAERLAKESNKLLKLLEEPPPQTLFVLITPNHKQLLTTILSRCQLFQLKPVAYTELAHLDDGAFNGSSRPSENQWKMAQYIPGNFFEQEDDHGQQEKAEQWAKELLDLLVQPPSSISTKHLELSIKKLSSAATTLQHKTLRYAAHFAEDYHKTDKMMCGELASILSLVALEVGQSVRISTRIMGLWLNLHQKFKL